MQKSILLKDDKLREFCKEINIDCNNTSAILIKINKNKAEYYNFDDDCFYKLDLDIAKKYV